ncbi:MAG TPA: serine/threonine-protein kinase, partial [Labilithrix sp.]|nr:serine/threonine-protein kinase [Labilithrix sp.]
MSSQTTLPTFAMPARYEAVARLGKGGGGEVWAVRDRVTGTELALKVLAEDAGEAEVMALVREAVTLSGLEGLGVPRVVAFGRLPRSPRRYLVRELVDGRSLEDVMDSGEGEWLRPLARAADQLTVLHRAGLFHGDIKPANVIVGADGMGTLVDLGLATPWREGGARAKGLTPKYAAPELLIGDPLTVRGEVYALGATLADAVTARGDELAAGTRAALAKIAARATEEDPQARYPSIDELASALKTAARLETRTFDEAAAWPVLGVDGIAQALTAQVARLAPGSVLAVVGPRRSGRTTLVRRLSWSLGVSGEPVANVEPARGPASSSAGRTLSARDVVELELDVWGGAAAPVAGLVVVVDDLGSFDDEARAALARAVENGARIVAVGDPAAVSALAPGANEAHVFEVPPLDATCASDLVKRA